MRATQASAALTLLALPLAACLGHGMQRIDAPCREMRSAVAYEMLKDNPTIPVIDVRRPAEVTDGEGRVKHAIAMPLERLLARPNELDRYRDTTVIVFGHDSNGGQRACQFLSSHGFKYVVFLTDGAEGWFRNGLPSTAPSTAESTTTTPTPSPSR
jgi:rhodanese-related sulfurtransferase